MKTIYDFEVFVKREVEKEVEKERKKKNKDTGKIEKWTETVKEIVEESCPYQILIKKPTRSMFEEADLFYSIQFNKYVKMGLLTNSQIAKKQIDVGDGFSEEQFDEYIKLKQLLVQKQDMLYRIMAKSDKEFSNEDSERKEGLIKDLSIIEVKLQSFDMLRVSAYEHTADSKAQSDTLFWWCLNLTYFIEGDSDSAEPRPMFDGDDFKTKKMKMEELEDAGDAVYNASYKTISEIVSIFYLMGISEKEDLSKTIEQMRKNVE